MIAGMIYLAIQAAQPAQQQPSGGSEPAAQVQDVYTACFMRELSRLEGRDVASSTQRFARRNASHALQTCQPAKAELTRSIEQEVAVNPTYSDQNLRAVEVQNRVATAELPLLMMIQLFSH